jgi:dUTP pyrophosphatase
MISVKILKLNARAIIPKRMTEHAAGYDLYSANPEEILLQPGKLTSVPTGIAISIPIGYEAQIRPRSGLVMRNQIGVLNSPGTIDADYRGEIRVLLYNFGEQDFVIKPNMRIAQMIIHKHEIVTFSEVEKLDETVRSNGGFGHTDLKNENN